MVTLLSGDQEADMPVADVDVTHFVFLLGFQLDVVEGDDLPTDLRRTTLMDLRHLV